MARGRRARGPHRTARGDAAKGQSPPQKHVAPEGMEAVEIAELVRDALVIAEKDGTLEEALKEMSEVGADAFAAAASETTSGGQDSPSLVPGVGPSAESCSSGSTPEAEATGTELQDEGASLAADGLESATWDKGNGGEKKVSERAVRRILKRYSEGLQVGGERPLSDEDDRLIRRVLQSHPKGVITDGAQVVRIMTRQLSSGTCFAAARSDGSVSEFAWRSCFKHEHRDYQAKAALQQKQPEQPNAGQAHCTMVQAPTACTPLLHTPAPPPQYSTLPLSYYADVPTSDLLQHVSEMASAPPCGAMPPPPNCYAAAMFAHPEMAAWPHHLACGSEGLPSYGGKGFYGKPDQHLGGQRHGPRGWKGHMGKNAYDMHGKAAGKGGRAPNVGSGGYPDTAAGLGNARSKRAALRALKQQQHQQYEKAGASRSAPGSGGQLHAGSIAGNEILGMLQQCGSGRRPRQVRGRWSEPQPLTTDEFLLVTVESREDAERNADKHNFDTFGEDVGPGGGAWDFESMMQANRSLVAEASVTHRRRQIMGYSASDQPVVFQ